MILATEKNKKHICQEEEEEEECGVSVRRVII